MIRLIFNIVFYRCGRIFESAIRFRFREQHNVYARLEFPGEPSSTVFAQ